MSRSRGAEVEMSPGFDYDRPENHTLGRTPRVRRLHVVKGRRRLGWLHGWR